MFCHSISDFLPMSWNILMDILSNMPCFLFYSWIYDYWRDLARVTPTSICSWSKYILQPWQPVVWFQLFVPMPFLGQARKPGHMWKTLEKSACAESGPAFSQLLRLIQIWHICPLHFLLASHQTFSQIYNLLNDLHVSLACIQNIKNLCSS